MKRIILILLFIAGGLSSKAVDYIGVDTAALNKAYRELMQDPSSPTLQRTFFDLFPSTWPMYHNLYRYSSRPGFDLMMYHAAWGHVGALEELNTIDRKEYCSKLIHIGIGGSWMADAPNYLEMLLERLLNDHTGVCFQVLSAKSPAQQLLFWRFIWESPVKHEKKTEMYNRLKKAMEKNYPQEVKTMGVAYDYFFGELPMGVDDYDDY